MLAFWESVGSQKQLAKERLARALASQDDDDNREWIKDVNENVNNADTLKMKVLNEKRPDVLSFRYDARGRRLACTWRRPHRVVWQLGSFLLARKQRENAAVRRTGGRDTAGRRRMIAPRRAARSTLHLGSAFPASLPV